MFGLMVAVHILASVFLIAVILFQAGKGGGLTENFGGGMMQNVFGASANTVLTKVTAACAVIFIFTSLTLTIMTTRRSKSLIELDKSKVEDILVKQKANAAAKPENTVTTVREVKVDPATGKETVVKEEKK